MAQRESTSALAWTFTVRVIRHWGALVTGGAIIAGVWFGNSVFGWQIPPWVNLVIAVGFFTAAAFQVWRDEYLRANDLEREPLRPIEVRRRLDDLVEQGRKLLAEWKSGGDEPPLTQTDLWDKSLVEFVDEYFNVRQNDIFRGHMLSTEAALEVVFECGETWGAEGHQAIQLIAKRMEALQKLRPEIGD
jgi:hypothetical protein